ncbi:MAG: acyl-CoA dehydrogenase [Planctomycetaceae bacterium]
MPTKAAFSDDSPNQDNTRGENQNHSGELMPCLSPLDQTLDHLCERLAALAPNYQSARDWPKPSLEACAVAGVFRWFLPEAQGGFGWGGADQVRGYLRLAEADLTTTFVITQFIGACKRMASSENSYPRDHCLARLLEGKQFATVAISHLTTSRQHLGAPVLRAEADRDGYRLNGMSPWVTGASKADYIVMAATLDDGRQLLANVPTDLAGVDCGPGTELVALSASRTDRVTLADVYVDKQMLIAGPMHDVMGSGTGAGTGGLQTSTLAAGLSRAAVGYLLAEAGKRPDLRPIADQLDQQTQSLCEALIEAASGLTCDANELRGRANRLVMRTTQAAMAAAKGAGYVATHPVGRWCREALFFLVWSCPQPVAREHLCELAGIE